MNATDTVLTDQSDVQEEPCVYKRSCDFEGNFSKRMKHEISGIPEQCDNDMFDNDTKSKCQSSDTDESNLDEIDNDSDIEYDDSNLSTDQSQYCLVVLNETMLQQKSSFSRHSKQLLKQFKYLCQRSKKKPIESTQCVNDDVNRTKKLRWELRNTFDRIDLLKEGYAVLSDEVFPFYSLCYMVCMKSFFYFILKSERFFDKY